MGADESDRETNGDEGEPLPKHQSDDLNRLGAQSQPHAEFLSPFADRESDHSANSGGCDEERKGGEDREKNGSQPRRGERIGANLLESLDVIDGLVRVEAVHGILDDPAECQGIASGSDEKGGTE